VSRKNSVSSHLKSALAALSTSAFALVTATSVAAACETSYQVKEGDTLSTIASQELGTVFAFGRMFEANGVSISDMSDVLPFGSRVSVPCLEYGALNMDVMPTASNLAFLMQAGSVQVLDIRDANDAEAGVIEGAVSSPYVGWTTAEGPVAFAPTNSELSDMISEAGLDLGEPLVIVHGGGESADLGKAARVYWLLKSAGAEDLAILRGGFDSWAEAELPVAAAVVPEKRRVQVNTTRRWRADTLDVIGIATTQMNGTLLDVRPHELFSQVSYNGKAISTTLPRAQHGPVDTLIAANAGEMTIVDAVGETVTFLEKNEMLENGAQVVVFDDNGELAALQWFLTSEIAGLDNMRVLPDTAAAWAKRGGMLFVGKK